MKPKGGRRPGAGRKRKELSRSHQQLIATIITEKKQRLIVEAIMNKAIDGDIAAATWCWDRLHGKPVENHAVTAIQEIRVTYGDGGNSNP